jgi:hypothetical protein
MPTDNTTRDRAVSTGTLWFGVAASVAAWFGLYLADILITWLICPQRDQAGGPAADPGARLLYGFFTLLLFTLAALAGTMSYRNWRRLSSIKELLAAEAFERKEFMALAGLFISFTLGVGIVWLGLPLFMIQMCLRTR